MYSAESYVQHIRNALDILHEEIPRALVNVVTYYDITPVTSLSDGLICDAIH